jgi:hypothetical protein
VRPVRRVLLAGSAAIALIAPHGGAALADEEGTAGGTGSAYIDSGGNPTAEATNSNGTSGSASTSGAASECTWRLLTADDTKTAMYDANGKRLYSPTGRWYQKICNGSPVEVNGSFAVPESQAVDPVTLAQRARQSVAIPDPPFATSPPADRRLYTRVPTWLWVDPAWWKGYSATAAAGAVSSTVVARPVRAIWTMGDGHQVTCDGPGTVWRSGMSDAQSSCSYVYKKASAGAAGAKFTMTVEVQFTVSWTSNAGAGGTLPSVSRSAARPVEVGEIQAVETQ